MTENKRVKKWYLVMRLVTEGTVTTVPSFQMNLGSKESGLAGMMPVFTNKRLATAASDKGRYSIVPVRAYLPHD